MKQCTKTMECSKSGAKGRQSSQTNKLNFTIQENRKSKINPKLVEGGNDKDYRQMKQNRKIIEKIAETKNCLKASANLTHLELDELVKKDSNY